MAEFSEELFTVPPPPDSGNLLSQCILKLPALQRQVIWLKYVDGYTLREIADMLNISLARAQKIDQRAKKQLPLTEPPPTAKSSLPALETTWMPPWSCGTEAHR